MKDYQLAWRNLWRNKRRTIITAASVFFAVFFALVMRSFQLGAYDRMFKNVIESYSGYLQLQGEDYFDDPTLDNGFVLNDDLVSKLETDPNVSAVVPRLESFAMAAAGSRTQGVMVMGIDPIEEEKVSDTRRRLVSFSLTPDAIAALKADSLPRKTKNLLDVFENESYAGTSRLMLDLDISAEDSAAVLRVLRRHASFRNEYIDAGDKDGVLIGSGLSKYLRITVGDTIVLLGQGYHATSAAGKYAVRGIIKLPTPDIDNIIVYMPIMAAGELYAAPGLVTSAVISIKSNDDKDVTATATRLGKMVSDGLVIRPWQELNAILVNQMDADNKSGMIMIGILYLVIAFGVFGTVLMMLAERKREFGMLVSIGMKKRKLAWVISLEMFMIGVLGVAAGLVAALPLIYYGNIHPLRLTGELASMYEDYGFEPVMPTLRPDTYVLWQTVVVLIILLIAIGFSIRKIFKINVINALRA
jgi:putative ABC transport system permease protein